MFLPPYGLFDIGDAFIHFTRPIDRVYALPHTTVERRPRPIRDRSDKPMLHRIGVQVIHVQAEIPLIPNQPCRAGATRAVTHHLTNTKTLPFTAGVCFSGLRSTRQRHGRRATLGGLLPPYVLFDIDDSFIHFARPNGGVYALPHTTVKRRPRPIRD